MGEVVGAAVGLLVAPVHTYQRRFDMMSAGVDPPQEQAALLSATNTQLRVPLAGP